MLFLVDSPEKRSPCFHGMNLSSKKDVFYVIKIRTKDILCFCGCSFTTEPERERERERDRARERARERERGKVVSKQVVTY